MAGTRKAKKSDDEVKEAEEVKEEKQEVSEKSVEKSVEKPKGKKKEVKGKKKKEEKKDVKEEEKPKEETKKEKREEKEAEGEEEEEGEFKLYTIPLRDAFNVPETRRASKAAKIIKAFLKRHTKSDVKLSASVNEAIWSRGIKKPPRVIRVKVIEKEVEKEGVKIPVKIAKLAG